MPSSPELGRALGDEGVVEVLKEVETEYLAKSDVTVRFEQWF